MIIAHAAPAVPKTAWSRARLLAVCLALAALTLVVFGQALRCGFIAFDDDRYVDQNPALKAGLSIPGLIWAFTTNLTRFSETAEYWQPLTSLTRLADYELYGFAPWGHHLTSVLLHLAAGLALFGALRRLTGAEGRSALVAALFLVHPMHVEPVLWLSARKDVVNGLFYILTLWAYGRYAVRPNWRRWLVVFAAVLGANMGKPMAVSLPFVLLLLDVWPLRRVDFRVSDWGRTARALVWEKAPFFLLTFGVAALAWLVQKEIGAVAGDDVLPLPWRLGNAALAVAIYVGNAFLPLDLALFYPHPGTSLNVWLAASAALGAVLVTFAVLRQWSLRPWLFVGWGWFLVVLAPVIGIIQIGDQALADRYSYLSFIGLFIAVIWQAAALSEQGIKASARVWQFAGATVVLLYAVMSFRQVQTWRSSETVFRQALAATERNYVAHYSLGAVLWEQGKRAEAVPHFQEAARIREPFLRHQLVAADEALNRGAFAEAIPRLTRVLMITPFNAELHYRLGTLLALNRESGKALMAFNNALKYRPEWSAPRISIAAVLLAEGQTAKAEKILHELLTREPDLAEARELLEKARTVQAANQHP